MPNEVCKLIKVEFENGKEYYQFHGKSLLHLPEEITSQPKTEFIKWYCSPGKKKGQVRFPMVKIKSITCFTRVVGDAIFIN